MTTGRAVRWDGTDQSWRAIVELYDGLESVAFRPTDETQGREQVPAGWWVTRRDDGTIEVRPPSKGEP
jgi:hypothetical protein